jgi:hypothetical protein
MAFQRVFGIALNMVQHVKSGIVTSVSTTRQSPSPDHYCPKITVLGTKAVHTDNYALDTSNYAQDLFCDCVMSQVDGTTGKCQCGKPFKTQSTAPKAHCECNDLSIPIVDGCCTKCGKEF